MNSAPEMFHYAGKPFVLVVICIWSLHMGTEESYSGLYVGRSPPFAQEQKLGNIIMEHVSLFLVVKQSGTSSISFKKVRCSWSGGFSIHLIWEVVQHHFNIIGHRKLNFSGG